jgi:hypothetical protein
MIFGTHLQASEPVAAWDCQLSADYSATQAVTTAPYAHLDNDPLRRASESIAGRIAAALEGNPTSIIIPMRQGKLT